MTREDEFLKERFIELEKTRNELVKKVHELAEKTGAQLALSNERVKKLEGAISKIKGKTWFDWALLIIQIVMVITVLIAVTKGYPVSVSSDGIRIEAQANKVN